MLKVGVAEEYNLNATEYGALIRLSAEEFLHGPLPNDLTVLCGLTRIPEYAAVITKLLAQFFTLGEDNLWRSKLVIIRWRKRGE
jgi:hypothetical protein